MSKQYGLIVPGKEKKPPPGPAPIRPSVFGSDSDSEGDQKPSRIGSKGPGETQKRQARLLQQKALEEDPTIFQYDEVFDDMATKKKEERETKKKVEDRQPKYIKKLLETAEKRKKEYERRVERQVQKERDEEGEQFKDKESFVTSSYKKKLEEMREAEEEEKKAEYLESIGDVRKQSNLDGFYRHLYEQTTGPDKDAPSTSNIEVPKGGESEKPGNVEVSKKERKYRKRKSSEEPEETKEDKERKVSESGDQAEAIRTHIASNLDADSDFSIDSTDSEEENGKEDPSKKEPNEPSKGTNQPSATSDFKSPIPNLVEPEKASAEENPAAKEADHEVVEEKPSPPPEKKPKIDIWAKRTVGEAFDEAVQRYFERKAERAGGY